MIICNEEKVNKVNEWNDDTIFVLTDFDRTLTSRDSYVSWDILSQNSLVSSDYIEEVNKLFKYYRPIEINENLSESIRSKYMIEWWNEEIKLFNKYGLNKDIISNVGSNMDLIKFRKGGYEFLKNMKDRNIPVIIISAGIGDFIENFLKYNNCYFDNVYVISNFLKYNNKDIVGFHGDIIHSLNKNIVTLSDNIKDLIELRNNIILMGDNVADINMVNVSDRESSLKIGFLEDKIEENKEVFLKNFDVVGINNIGFDILSEKVKILKK